jgi:hypothetical protein
MRLIITLVVVSVSFFTLSYVAFPYLASVEYTNGASIEKKESPKEETPPIELPKVVETDNREVIKHVPLPVPTKVIYMTSCVAGTIDFRDRLIKLIDETEINAVIIDIKDFSGTISFPAASDAWRDAWEEARCGSRDMKGLVKLLHDKEIFVIGRITVFQDPFYTKIRPDLAVLKASDGTVWHDRKGLSFIDVGSHEYWDHIIQLAVDSYDIGFDELNFDYVRYPSDGNMEDIAFPNSMKGAYGANKPANLEAFFKYLNEKLDDESLFRSVKHENTGREKNTPWTSVDLFGMTTTNTDDLSIGQVQERAAPYFDFVAPMVYPSHYPNGFMDLGNPNDQPYKVVHHAMAEAVRRMMSSTTPVEGFQHVRIGTSTPSVYTKPVYGGDRLRTWIQDFDYGGDYDATDVRNQIQASYDAGVQSFMIWAPSNIYTREALNAQ